ncbi:MAG: 3-deoxy-7-phosphoheptulonate synthase [Defluviitaleaceae bacterium]|nr:3-deoxy-7-phosphoheptulonate synthase [Defluviitaleaceae bacterium]
MDIKKMRDREIKDIFEGRSSKLLLVVGPCSVHCVGGVLAYAKMLAPIAEEIAHKAVVVVRAYTAKPRSETKGFMGLLHQEDGLEKAIKLHKDILEQTGLPTADELLYPSLLPHFKDVVSYFTIGARSVLNQEHRLVASHINVPVGMKNPLNGSLSGMELAVAAGKRPHQFIFRDELVESAGNPLTHGVYRGFIDEHGEHKANWMEALKDTSPVLVDVSHSNSKKDPARQGQVVREVLKLREKNPNIKGLMIESFIEGGRQDEGGKVFGKSITDPCLGFEDTRELLRYIFGEI